MRLPWGEYQGISDFEINQYTNNIEILDLWGSVFAYNNQGVFIEKYNLPDAIKAVHYFTNLNDDIVYFYSRSEMKKIYVYSKSKSKVIKSVFEVPKNINGPLQIQNSPFFKHDNKVLFYQGYTNDVFVVNENNFGFDVYYRWDFGDNNIEIDDLPEIEEGNIDDIRKYINAVIEGNFVNSFFYNYENKRVRLTSFKFNRSIYSLIYDKQSNNYKIFDSFKEKVSPPFKISNYDDGLFSIVEPMNLDSYINDEILTPEQSEVFENIHISSNPVIVRYKIKVENE
ncbi:MAG: 6-bladed beta-propeller [Prolixibacteraceae bacterium]|nr:6-bladed beta-propeller [Prolixibacteraceae bacterium]